MNRVAAIAFAFAVVCTGMHAANVTNTVLMVDQDGKLNVEGVASVAEVATNSVKAQIAEAKADAAQQTARGVSGAIDSVVDNIMSNNVFVYRSGFIDSFAPLVVVSESDILAVAEIRKLEASASRIVVEIDYVTTVQLGTVKPAVMFRESLSGPRDNFAELPDGMVSSPVYHEGTHTFAGQVFTEYYTITATIQNPAHYGSHFFWIKADVDAPAGDGSTLDLPNGVTGGWTIEVTWGDKILTFKGGLLKGVRNVDSE